jgi:Kef-type K+ transport system membrane component KefB
MVHAADTLREGEFLADYERVEEYVDKLEIIFAPLFFAIIGAQVNLNGINLDVLLLSSIIIAVAIVSKLIGCGLPASIFLRDKSKAMKVGIGMISRGEVGLIVAGIGGKRRSFVGRCLCHDNHHGCRNYINHSFVAKESIW